MGTNLNRNQVVHHFILAIACVHADAVPLLSKQPHRITSNYWVNKQIVKR